MEQSPEILALDPISAIPEGVELPDVSAMPAEISYLFVLKREEPKSKVADVLTYTGSPTLSDLLVKYVTTTGYAPQGAVDYYFSLTNHTKLLSSLTTLDILKLLARESLDGILLYIDYIKEEHQEGDYIDECCMIDYFANEKEFGLRKIIWLRFEISLQNSPNTEVIYLESRLYDTGSELLQNLVKEVRKQFGLKNLTRERIIACNYINQAGKAVKLLDSQPLTRQQVYKDTTILVNFSNPNNEQLKRVNMPHFNSWILVYRENQSEPVKFSYDQVAPIAVSELYKKTLQLKQSKNRRDAVYCLKIMDRILKPHERLDSAEIYFKNSDVSKPLNVVAKVVNEKMIFYKAIPALTADKKSQFKLNQIKIPQGQRQHRERCQRTIRQRAQKAPKEYFRVIENVQPIVIYTSQLKYLDEASRQQMVIYQSLNKLLRDTPILSLHHNSFLSEWRLRYASTLLKHLEKTQIFQGQTWRGISYDPSLSKKDVGVILTFRQFTSTSKFQKVAITFAKKYGSKAPFHLFAFKVKTGRSIIEYSLYGEGEILLEPFTEFELMAVDDQNIDGVAFKIYRMEERVTSKVLPEIKGNFIIWIDNKMDEGRKIFESINLPKETCLLEQLTSNLELEQWLKRHSEIFSDKTANVMFLTNMTRKQGNFVNENAGIDAARLIRKVNSTTPIFFYVGNLENTNKRLDDSKLNRRNIHVGISRQQVISFLRNCIQSNL